MSTAPVIALPGGENPPENRIHAASALCSEDLGRHGMTGLLVQILRDHFADPSNILIEMLRRRFVQQHKGWTAEADSPMLIESITAWKPTTTEKRTAIVVRPMAWSAQNRLINKGADADPYTGTTNYVDWWNGSHQLICLGGGGAGVGAEAEYLAVEVAKLMVSFQAAIVRFMDLHRFQVSDIEGPQEIKEVSKDLVVPVRLLYVHEEKWSVTPDAPRLKRIEFSRQQLWET